MINYSIFMKKIILLFLLWLSMSFLNAKTYGDIHNVIFLRCYDGDTCTFTLPYLHPLIGESISIRISGYDTPELHGKGCKKPWRQTEKARRLAIEAKEFVNKLLSNAPTIILKNVFRPKYFRIGATLVVDGVDLTGLMIKKGFAVRYNGGRKSNVWCELKLNSYSI